MSILKKFLLETAGVILGIATAWLGPLGRLLVRWDCKTLSWTIKIAQHAGTFEKERLP